MVEVALRFFVPKVLPCFLCPVSSLSGQFPVLRCALHALRIGREGRTPADGERCSAHLLMETPVERDLGVVTPTGELRPCISVACFEGENKVFAGCSEGAREEQQSDVGTTARQ